MSNQVDRLLTIIGELREHCVWTKALTHAQLVEYLIEESYELVETIEEEQGDTELKGELGDLLWQIVLHSAIAEERGSFTFDDVAAALADKMIRRNVHIYRPDGTLQDSFPKTNEEVIEKWDAAKRAEMPERKHPFAGLPESLPALMYAEKAIDRAARWEAGTGEKVPFPAPSVERSPRESAVEWTEESFGAHMLTLVRKAHEAGIDSERALRRAVKNWKNSI
ncbi:MazG nucleotide pyrophosphohydrolase domain-containing protein [Neomicrococcus lactis]